MAPAVTSPGYRQACGYFRVVEARLLRTSPTLTITPSGFGLPSLVTAKTILLRQGGVPF